MPISFHCYDIMYKIRNAGVHKQWLSDVITSHKHKEGDINIIFCTDKYLLEINKQYLQHSYYTDIITFDYTKGKTISGDLYISVAMVKYNAKQYHVAVSAEIRRVMVHGLLHLLGYNDKSEKEIMDMRSAEAKWLERYLSKYLV